MNGDDWTACRILTDDWQELKQMSTEEISRYGGKQRQRRL